MEDSTHRISRLLQRKGPRGVIGRIEVKPENVNVSAVIGGTNVNPGDMIAGDDDGVVVVPREVASEVLELKNSWLWTEKVKNHILTKWG